MIISSARTVSELIQSDTGRTRREGHPCQLHLTGADRDWNLRQRLRPQSRRPDLATGAAEAAFAEILPHWQPLPNLGSTEDIAQAALFLASDAARLINGHNLVVDGGITAGWPAAVARDDQQRFRNRFRAEMTL